MSKSACRLARVLCGIWFKTVDAIIVRMTQLSLDDPGQHFGIDGLVREGLPVFAFFLNRLKKLIEGLSSRPMTPAPSSAPSCQSTAANTRCGVMRARRCISYAHYNERPVQIEQLGLI
jgi:hypothetical protein